MTAHKHAALMLQYAQDAVETDSPWERWEYRTPDGGWWDMDSSPCWDEGAEYRRKPQVIRVGRHEFPKPITKGLVNGVIYCYVKIGNNCFDVGTEYWTGSGQDQGRLESRRAHLTREAAQAHADVLNAICRGDIE